MATQVPAISSAQTNRSISMAIRSLDRWVERTFNSLAPAYSTRGTFAWHGLLLHERGHFCIDPTFRWAMWDQWDAVVPHGKKVGCGVGIDRYAEKNTFPPHEMGVVGTGQAPRRHLRGMFFAVFWPSLPPHEADDPADTIIRCATKFRFV